MGGVKTHYLNKIFDVKVGRNLEYSAAVIARVDEIWTIEKEERGDRLTNGNVFHLADYNTDSIRIQPTEYRYVLARRRDPSLIEKGLKIRPLAVTGILFCDDGLVLGRRGANVSDDNGLWEPAPAGGLAQPDPMMQVLEELEEELGIVESEVVSAVPCGLVEDELSGVFDIVFRLETGMTGHDVRVAFASTSGSEHMELAFVQTPDIETFLLINREHLLPALPSMLRIAGVKLLRL